MRWATISYSAMPRGAIEHFISSALPPRQPKKSSVEKTTTGSAKHVSASTQDILLSCNMCLLVCNGPCDYPITLPGECRLDILDLVSDEFGIEVQSDSELFPELETEVLLSPA